MIGSLITRVLVLIFGYVYPAYECFKSVEMNKPDIDQLRFWCQYWILVAGLTVGERIADTFIGWIPMYGEAKLAFFIYLWFPKTKGTTYVYDSFFRPYVAKHEPEIDRSLVELRTRAGDMVILYWQRAASYSQTRIFEILQYIASQSPPSKPPQQVIGAQKPNVPPKPTQSQDDSQPSSPASNTTSSSEQQEDDTADEAGPSEVSKAAPTPAPPSLNEQKTTPSQSLVERTKSLNSDEGKTVRIDSALLPNGKKDPAPAQEVTMAEALRVTRARSRRTKAATK